MDSKVKEVTFKIMLWKDILSIPIYTIIFNNYKLLFWLLIVVDRLVVLLISLKIGYVEEFIDIALEGESLKDKQLIIFSMISGLVLYGLTFINNRKLFYILIIAEIADFIVLKLIKD
ncbi:hypothetical protein [Romboutsia sp.]|uniref:hypothetical protein n=1 Tax=Romboutsia sp. TaxID=1965302 RepID=UPI003F391669